MQRCFPPTKFIKVAVLACIKGGVNVLPSHTTSEGVWYKFYEAVKFSKVKYHFQYVVIEYP